MPSPMWIKKIIKPARIARIQEALGQRKHSPLRILDVGCGPHVMNTKAWFNVLEYHGVDRHMWPGFEHLYANLDKLFLIDLETPELAGVPDGHYDLIILSHVIEHLSNGLEVVELITRKLAPGGCLYIESPSKRTINLPSAIGFMNFYDDPTHKRLYFDDEIIHILQKSYLQVLYTGYRRTWARAILIPPLSIVLNLFYFLPFKRRISSWGLWELLGIARVWVAIRGS
ncbi:MAG TPA: class I SAM-dependent methyltransferase [Acidobacteriaceae bacterium]|nr:class I SAM-dependent methyltransferase [Acidobacteriaceae bacterium]